MGVLSLGKSGLGLRIIDLPIVGTEPELGQERPGLRSSTGAPKRGRSWEAGRAKAETEQGWDQRPRGWGAQAGIPGCDPQAAERWGGEQCLEVGRWRAVAWGVLSCPEKPEGCYFYSLGPGHPFPISGSGHPQGGPSVNRLPRDTAGVLARPLPPGQSGLPPNGPSREGRGGGTCQVSWDAALPGAAEWCGGTSVCTEPPARRTLLCGGGGGAGVQPIILGTQNSRVERPRNVGSKPFQLQPGVRVLRALPLFPQTDQRGGSSQRPARGRGPSAAYCPPSLCCWLG